MKKIRLLLTVFSLLVSSVALLAQNVTVKGTVTDAATGEPMIAVTVSLKGGTNVYALTDDLGNYSISVPGNGVLVFTSMGYKTLEVPVNNRTTVNAAIDLDAAQLEETIIVGYGTAKKISSVVGSAVTVGTKKLENRPVASVGDALQGQVAGLQVFTSSGEPSATVSMRLRGVNSINASTTPLFILDGTPVSSSIFTTLNSNDISNITVLKDASSTAIYGSRAANGVVYITTKKGVTEKPTIRLTGSYGISNLAQNPTHMMNSEEYFRLRETIDPTLLNNQQFQDLKNFRLENNISADWREWILNENAPTVSADLSISGRNERSDYYISFGTFSQEGIQPYSFLDRYQVRSNVNTKANDWLKVGLNLSLTYQENRSAGYSTTGNSWNNPMNVADWTLPYEVPWEILTDEQGNFLGYGEERDRMEGGTWNYFYLMDLQPSETNYIRLNGSTYQEITPLKGLVIRSVQALEGYDYRYSRKILIDDYSIFTPSASESMTRYYNLTATNTAEYKFNIADNHNFVALVGQEAIVTQSENFGASATGMSDNRLNDVDQGTTFDNPSYGLTETAYNSYFGRLSYDYDSKYILEGTVRRDGSSLFGSNMRYATFYSVGASWNAKREKFLSNVSWLNSLQLKASYGTTGNSGISAYLANASIVSSTIYGGNASWNLSGIDNPDLTWETVESLNIGVNTRLFDMVNLDLEFYNKYTKDMLLSIPYSFATGASSGWGNVGTMLNRGIDVTLGVDLINTSDILFNVSGTFNYNYNEIVELFGGRDEFVVANTGIKYEVGKTLGEYYYVRWVGVDPATGKQVWLDKDGNQTFEYSDDDAVFTGKQRYAPIAAGLQLNFSWKNLSLNADFTGVFGKWVINNNRYFIENANFAGDMNQTKEMANIWTTPGQITNIPKAGETLQFDTHLLENASFVRLKNLQLSYSLPQSFINKSGFISGARFYVIGRNLLTFTEYTGYDPEVDSNLQLGNYPNSQQFSVGVELTF